MRRTKSATSAAEDPDAAVLRREPDGVFRLLHQHYSWAVPDEVGMEHAQAWREELGLAPVG